MKCEIQELSIAFDNIVPNLLFWEFFPIFLTIFRIKFTIDRYNLVAHLKPSLSCRIVIIITDAIYDVFPVFLAWGNFPRLTKNTASFYSIICFRSYSFTENSRKTLFSFFLLFFFPKTFPFSKFSLYLHRVSKEARLYLLNFPLELAPRKRKEHFIHPRSVRIIGVGISIGCMRQCKAWGNMVGLALSFVIRVSAVLETKFINIIH